MKLSSAAEQDPRRATERQTYHHGDLKRALTEATLLLVTERGPKGFTLREVARRAGVSVSAPYRHFSDKEALLASAATQGFTSLHESLAAAASQAHTPESRLLAMGRTYVEWAIAHAAHYQVMFGVDHDKSDNAELLAASSTTFEDMLEAIRQCQQHAGTFTSADPYKVAGPVWSVLHGTASLAIGQNLTAVGICYEPGEIVDQALRAMLFAESPTEDGSS